MCCCTIIRHDSVSIASRHQPIASTTRSPPTLARADGGDYQSVHCLLFQTIVPEPWIRAPDPPSPRAPLPAHPRPHTKRALWLSSTQYSRSKHTHSQNFHQSAACSVKRCDLTADLGSQTQRHRFKMKINAWPPPPASTSVAAMGPTGARRGLIPPHTQLVTQAPQGDPFSRGKGAARLAVTVTGGGLLGSPVGARSPRMLRPG